MKKHLTILIILFLPFFVQSQNKKLVLTHVSVIDVTSENLKPEMTVIITGNKITSISNRVKIPLNATVINARGKYLIPGLWDMHVHIRN